MELTTSMAAGRYHCIDPCSTEMSRAGPRILPPAIAPFATTAMQKLMLPPLSRQIPDTALIGTRQPG